MGGLTDVLVNFQLAVAQSQAFTVIFLVLSFLGCARLTIFLWKYFRVLADLFLIPGVNFSKYGAGKGAWALVTGSSDGIGKEFALQLARKGFNIILVSRTESKLEEVAEAITARYANVQVKYYVMDFALNRPQDYETIAELVSENEVSVLVNNVGQSHSIPVPFLDTHSQEMDNIIAINDVATLKITQIVAKHMAHRKKGLILTMGSFGGLFPTPFLATYSGSKAFLQQWSSAIAAELKPLNVDVEFVLSYLVTSSMSKIRRPSAMIPTPRAFVASTLSGVGKHGGSQGRYATLTPFWSHALLQFFVENTVGVYSGVASAINYKFHLDIRRRALRKAEKQAKSQ